MVDYVIIGKDIIREIWYGRKKMKFIIDVYTAVIYIYIYVHMLICSTRNGNDECEE